MRARLQVSWEARAAKLFSEVFTPFAVAAVISITFSWFSPIGLGPSMNPMSSALAGIATLCLAPLVPVLCCVMTGRTDLDVSDPTRRVPLYGLGSIGYVIGIVMFGLLHNRLMFVMALAYLCVTLAVAMITLAWKVSAHTAGIAGPTTALVFVFGIWAVTLYALSIVMVWARVTLHSHTRNQAIAGVIVAIMITSIVFRLFYR